MKLSVITPVYNREDCIGRCINSVIANLKWNVDIEHIIVDDGSTDNSLTVCSKYAYKYKHIKVFEFVHNMGTNAARNKAISESSGDYGIILDSDDFFTDDAIKIICEAISKNPDYKHYMFAPNDRTSCFARTEPFCKGKHVFSYVDFLAGEVNGDFIHVVSIFVLKKYPFNEEMRTYEVLNFLRYYREDKFVLFINKMVTIRDRGRKDCVTKDFIRMKKCIVERELLYLRSYINNFTDDCLKYNLKDKLITIHKRYLDNLLLLSKYNDAENEFLWFKVHNTTLPLVYYIIYHFKLSKLYFVFLKYYLIFKYKVLKTKII